jgi:hypothetical protein
VRSSRQMLPSLHMNSLPGRRAEYVELLVIPRLGNKLAEYVFSAFWHGDSRITRGRLSS